MFDTQQAAQRLGCSVGHVGTLIRTGRLKAVNIGGGEKLPRWRIPEQSLLDFLRIGEDITVEHIQTR